MLNSVRRLRVCLLLVSTLVPLITLAASEQSPELALNIDAELKAELQLAYKAQGPDYQPRTEHLFEDGSPHYINRLIREDSPYLIQHAHNPINWYSWGEAAMQAAKAQQKPIFLSIGYATCHWCHVMERESFENIEIARYINEHFIAIKVDREQKPDIDSTYMTAVQMLTGSGGWPMSTWLTPEAKPFYGGTYFPPARFLDLLTRITQVWGQQRDAILEEAEQIADALARVNTTAKTVNTIGSNMIAMARDELLEIHDDLQGGFGPAPKFPRESSMFLLLEQAKRHTDEAALEAVDFSLQRIAAGGIHDQLAGGFHRYAVDNDWLIPHFEKMLYSQAGLSRLYAQAYELTGDWEFARVARRTLDYVLRDMSTDKTLFYSATDADSEGMEGRFFIWSEEEIDALLSPADAQLAKRVWNMSENGNFESYNILHWEGPIEDVAASLDVPSEQLLKSIERISNTLLSNRETREHPIRDEKIITEWNAMLITALVEVGELTGDTHYIDAAITSMESLLDAHFSEDGTLWRVSFKQQRSTIAKQSDYANLAEALIALYDSTGSLNYLDLAERFVEDMDKQFWDAENGAYFMGEESVNGVTLPVRPKEVFDNSLPAGNSIALKVLVRLHNRTGKDEYLTRAQELVSALVTKLEISPSSFGYLLSAVSEMRNGEMGSRLYTGRGNVRVSAKKQFTDTANKTIDVVLEMKPGWHINAHKPKQDYLIGTSVTDAGGEIIGGVSYPEAKLARLGFDRSELALYEGSVTLQVPLSALEPNGMSVPVNVNVQACNDTVCLAPETIELTVSLANDNIN